MKNKYNWAKKELKAREKGHKLRFFHLSNTIKITWISTKMIFQFNLPVSAMTGTLPSINQIRIKQFDPERESQFHFSFSLPLLNAYFRHPVPPPINSIKIPQLKVETQTMAWICSFVYYQALRICFAPLRHFLEAENPSLGIPSEAHLTALKYWPSVRPY